MNPVSFAERRPWLALAIINLLIWTIVLICLEVWARATASYAIDYYKSIKSPGVHRLPYGEVHINSQGFHDEEFDLDSPRPRVGYIGDSVNFGLGVGYGHRISDLLQEMLPAYEHWNIGAGLGTEIRAQHVGERVDQLELDTVVYLLNLNDLSQVMTADGGDSNAGQNWLYYIRRKIIRQVDYFRHKSYLYNLMRYKLKTFMQKLGYDSSGRHAVELYPIANEAIIRESCNEMNRAYEELRKRGVELCVLLLPYEMQISRKAAEAYRKMGFAWEDGFEDGSPQRLLHSCLRMPHIYDARAAFDDRTAQLGEFFIYDKGDKIDWNHPNRAGHRRIAERYAKSGSCRFLKRSAPSGGTANAE